MSPRLRALLLAAGTAVIAGVVAIVYIPRPGITIAQLADAGISADCNLRRISCTVFDRRDGGYAEREFTIAVCGRVDGGMETIWPPEASNLRRFIVDENFGCRRVGNGSANDFVEAPPRRTFSCACWKQDAGDCTQIDGGTTIRDSRNDFDPGDWAGPGCIAKPCGELYGLNGTPPGCLR